MFKSVRGGAVVLLVAGLAGCLPLGERKGGEPRAGAAGPLTEGADADGRPLRLADYRGKVVLLHFWHSA